MPRPGCPPPERCSAVHGRLVSQVGIAQTRRVVARVLVSSEAHVCSSPSVHPSVHEVSQVSSTAGTASLLVPKTVRFVDTAQYDAVQWPMYEHRWIIRHRYNVLTWCAQHCRERTPRDPQSGRAHRPPNEQRPAEPCLAQLPHVQPCPRDSLPAQPYPAQRARRWCRVRSHDYRKYLL